MKRFNSVNAMWNNACQALAMHGQLQASRAGETIEVVGWAGQLVNVDRNVLVSKVRRMDPAYACAELLWYLRHDGCVRMLCAYAPSYKRFANPPIEDGMAWGAYGARWRDNPGFASGTGAVRQFTGHALVSQIDAAVQLLKDKPDSRQAVVTMWDSGDLAQALIGSMNDMPCTLSMQFLIRSGVLHCVVSMRSNDVWLGMPYDVFCFTSIQRIVASRLGVRSGTYTHCVGSLHAYRKDADKHGFVTDMPNAKTQDIGVANAYDEQLGRWNVQEALAAEEAVRLDRSNLRAFAEVAQANGGLAGPNPGTVLTDAATICARRLCPKAADLDKFVWSNALKQAWNLKHEVEP